IHRATVARPGREREAAQLQMPHWRLDRRPEGHHLSKMIGRFLVLLTLMANLQAVAQAPKKPWELTLEERIALRTNPALAQARARTHRRVAASSNEGTALVDSFDGKTHPELFIPQQVYRTLMSMAFLNPSDGGAELRRVMIGEVTGSGLPVVFWDRLAAISAGYLQHAREERRLAESLSRLQGRARVEARRALAAEQVELCRSAAASLGEARREFGEPFDRFLYTAIAVHMFHAADELPRAEDLRKIEQGCR
ncbi:MAG TPA: hypothetical protein VM733_09320, partial [Thermoanaerobaculia bacterium]|nr:hypothetical protein [Thermoanaerobaculia bacterium]